MTLAQLPIGAKVRDPHSGTAFLVAAHSQPGYTSTVLVTDRIVRKGCVDAKEPDSADPKVKKYGNNQYAQSNVHQWLNSREQTWYQPAHATDAPPTAENVSHAAGAYAEEPGFLARFSPAFLDALVENQIPYAVLRDGEWTVDMVAGSVFLLSADELGLTRFTGVAEGSLMPLFQDFRMRLGIKEAVPADFNFPDEVTETNQEMGWYYWLRTPHHRYPFLTAHVHFSGYISYLHAYNSELGIRPALTISGQVPVRCCEGPEPVYELILGGASQ